jgi:hypothetical protein
VADNAVLARKTVPAAGSQPAQLTTALQGGVEGVTIKAMKTNAADVELGVGSAFTAGTGFPLSAGENITLPVNNAANIYIRGTQNDVVAIAGVKS